MPAAHLRGPEIRLDRKPGCTGKLGYQSVQDARRWLEKRGNSTRNIYECAHCGHWHHSLWRKKGRP